MGGAIAKFTHPFNGPMAGMQQYNTLIPGDLESRSSGKNFLNGITSYTLGYRSGPSELSRPQMPLGPPHHGKASVDGLGNLSFKGAGYTYIFRLPNDGEGDYSHNTSSSYVKVHRITSIDSTYKTNIYGSNQIISFDDGPTTPYSVDWFFDKNMGPAYYLHTNYPLKKGKHIVIMLLGFPANFNPNNRFYYATDWTEV